MKRIEALVAIVAIFAMVTTGAVWLAGPWGLFGSALAVGIVLAFVDVKE